MTCNKLEGKRVSWQEPVAPFTSDKTETYYGYVLRIFPEYHTALVEPEDKNRFLSFSTAADRLTPVEEEPQS